jgi:PKD repeat protein
MVGVFCWFLVDANAGAHRKDISPMSAEAGRAQYVYTGEKAYLNATASTGAIREYRWECGDGATADGPVAFHVYTEPGDYQVTLTVSDADGATATDATTVHVRPAPDTAGPMDFRALGIFPSDTNAMPWDRAHTDSPDVDPNAPMEFYQLDAWERELDTVSGMGYNALFFITNHPYPYLVKNPAFPEGQPITDAELDRNIETFSAVIDLAARRGIKLYFLVYNIFSTEAFAKAHDLPTGGQDDPLLRKYTAGYIEAMYRQYPDFGGLVVTVGEWPLGCVDFCREAIFEPLAKIGPRTFVIIRDQGLYTDEMFRLAQGLDNWSVLVKITEEQFTGDAVGPRARMHRLATGMPSIYLVSWLPDGTLQGSWRMIRDLVKDARAQYGRGFFVQGGKEPEWLMREAFGYFMTHPETTDDEAKAHFESLVRSRFGDEIDAALFLETADAVSWVLPTVRRQLYSRNWNYRAAYGLVLESFLALPTYSGFTLPDIHRPGTDLERQFMDWLPREEKFHEDYLSVREYVTGVDRSASERVVTPEQTIANLRRRAKLCMDNLPALRRQKITGEKEPWESYLLQAEFLAQMARFYADKLEAALAWERWGAGKLTEAEAATAILAALERSIGEYEQATALYEKLHGAGAPQKTFRMIASGDAGHYAYPFKVRGGMRELLGIFRSELEAVRDRLRTGNHQLPTFDALQISSRASE